MRLGATQRMAPVASCTFALTSRGLRPRSVAARPAELVHHRRLNSSGGRMAFALGFWGSRAAMQPCNGAGSPLREADIRVQHSSLIERLQEPMRRLCLLPYTADFLKCAGPPTPYVAAFNVSADRASIGLRFPKFAIPLRVHGVHPSRNRFIWLPDVHRLRWASLRETPVMPRGRRWRSWKCRAPRSAL